MLNKIQIKEEKRRVSFSFFLLFDILEERLTDYGKINSDNNNHSHSDMCGTE
jgi:hypothetical protein